MTKKRLWFLFIVMGLLTLLLAACGESNDDANNKDKNEESNTTVNEDSNKQKSDKDEVTSEGYEKSAENQDSVIEISAFEMGYDPDLITLKKGQEYEFVLTNDGSVFHDLTSSELKAEITFTGKMADHPDEVSFLNNILGVSKVHANGDDHHNDGHSEKDDSHGHNGQNLHMNAKEGQTVRVKFIPKEVGEFEFFCSVPGHKEAGMVGKVKVVE